jgi:hypothetical protein
MLTPEYHLACYIIHEERIKGYLRETEYKHLAQISGLQQGTTQKRYRQVLNWLGRHMVKGGIKLQSYTTPDKNGQEALLKAPIRCKP